MTIIEQLKKEVFSIQERFITTDTKSLMTDPGQLTMEPKNPDAEAERSFATQGTVYREPDSAAISPKDEFGIDQDDIKKDGEPPAETPEQKEVSEREELNLCLDLIFEAILRAKEIAEANEDLEVFDAEMMKRIEDASSKAVEFADMVENKVYDYDDDVDSDDNEGDAETQDDEEEPGNAEEEPKE